jgi:flagellar basal body-associated protein FliL
MNLILGALLIIAIVVFIVLLCVAAITMISRSRGKHGTSGSLSSAALEIQSILEPEKKRVVETMRAQQESEDEDDRLQSPPR